MGWRKNWVVGEVWEWKDGGAEEPSAFKRRVILGPCFHDLPQVSPTPPPTGTASYFSIGLATPRSLSIPPRSAGIFRQLGAAASLAHQPPRVSAASDLFLRVFFPSCTKRTRVNSDLFDGALMAPTNTKGLRRLENSPQCSSEQLLLSSSGFFGQGAWLPVVRASS
jgi:hypothetical protein